MSGERFGIFELSEKSQAKTVDVVAVHGIMGHPFETWKHENGKLWLRDFLATDLPFARIMTFGYDSAVAFSKGVGNIEDNARSLLNQLSLERATSGSEGRNGRPIVFVCHSLGGIIVKKAMVLAHERNTEPDFKDILDNTKAMAFLSVPHKGADIAWWGNFGANILKSASLGTSTSNKLIKDLKKHSPALMDISKQFVPRTHGLTVYAFYERTKTGPILVVDEDSATIGIANERLFPVNADHHTICRFESAESQAYKAVGTHVVSLVRSVAPGEMQLTKEQLDCIRSLYLSDPDAAKDRVPPRAKGTCGWLLDHPSYRSWLKPDGPPLLWVTGAPGMGKTVLASFIIDQMRLYHPQIMTCFFFWDDKYALQKNSVALLRGILFQIFHHRQNLSTHALTSWRDTAGKAFEEPSVLWRICIACFDDPLLGELVCILDAVDECQTSERSQLMMWIAQYFKNRPPNTNRVKFILTSRPEITMSDILDDSTCRIKLEIRTDRDWLSVDIENFIDHEIKTLPALRNLTEASRRRLRDRLVQNADRTFLWASLVLQKIPFEVQLSEDGFATMLSRIPDRLEQLYRDILMLIPPENRDKSRKMLSILTMAQNPLSQEELQECWAIEQHHVSVSHMISNQVPDIRRTVALLCGQFVRWEKPKQKLRGESNKSNNSEECRLVHQSAKEFLLMNTDLNPLPLTGQPWYILHVAEAASLMASKCVWFANLQEFSDNVVSPRRIGLKLGNTAQFIWKPEDLEYGLQQCCKQHRFLRYTLRYWAHHYREVEIFEASLGPDLQTLVATVIRLYRDNTSLRAHWFMRMLRMTGTRLTQEDCLVPAVVYCAYNGHKTILPSLVMEPSDLNAPIFQLGFTALHMAVLGKHLRLVEWLLSNNAEIGAIDAWGRTPLHLAARRNSIDVLQYLLNHDADVFRKDMYGSTPIQGARDRQLSKHVDILSEHERSHERLQSESRPQSQLAPFRLIRDDDSTTGNQPAGECALEPNYEYHALNFPWEECNELERSSESSSERQSLSHSATPRSSLTLSRRRSSAHLRKGSSVHSRESSSDSNVHTTGRGSSSLARSSASIESFRLRRRNQSLPDDHRHVERGRRRLNETSPKMKKKRRPVMVPDYVGEQHDSAQRGSMDDPWAAKAILALDGGGVRSYSSILILRELMNTIIEREKSHLGGVGPANSSWHPLRPFPYLLPDFSTEESSWLPCHYFDFVGGTSSGGLISILLGRLRLDIDEAIANFENIFAKILERTPQFDRRWPLFWSRDTDGHEIFFNASLKELILRRQLADPISRTSVIDGSFKSFKSNDKAACRTVVIGCRRSSQSGHPKPCLFRSHDFPSQESDLNGPVHLNEGTLPIWQVARCALAIPRYLKPVQIEGWEYVDGSLVAHNPMRMLIREVMSTSNRYIAPRIVISIGSGNPNKRSGSKSSPITDLDLRRDFDERTYFRFDVEDGLETIKADEWRVKSSMRAYLLRRSQMKRRPRNKTLDTITEHTLAYISTDEVQKWISQCAEILVEIRRRRVEDPDRWEKRCCGSSGLGSPAR